MDKDEEQPTTPTPGDDRESRLEASHAAVETLLRQIETQFAIVTGKAKAVAAACQSLREQPGGMADGAESSRHALRLATLLRRSHGELAHALFPLLTEQLAAATHPSDLATELLQSRDKRLRRKAVEAVLERWAAGDLTCGSDLASRFASAVTSTLQPGESSAADASLLDQVAGLLRDLFPGDTGLGSFDPLERLLMSGHPDSLRALAARLLDRGHDRVPPGRLERLLGPEASAILGEIIEYTRASHCDLVDLTPAGSPSAAWLAELAEVQKLLGLTALGAVIGELGWRALSWGIWAERRVGLSIDGSFPFAIAPDDVETLEECGSPRRRWDRCLVVAHGGSVDSPASSGQEAAAVKRFRRYNLLHAELLGEILEVAPVTPEKVSRILAALDEVVDHFAVLFADHSEDAKRVADCYNALRAPVMKRIAGVPADQPLDAEVTRLVQMFEDPQTLDDVRTLHGLKRYLHQKGLRLAFRCFRSGQAANRTVDLALVEAGRVSATVRKIRYIDFEPHARPGEIPFFPSLVVEALGRRLLQGWTDAPDLEILIYGNEVQTYVAFRNHPAFLRIDFSPPLRGGMIDLEYFGVSQYELEDHPDISLPFIQRIFRRLDFDAQEDGLRLHIRYDKERAVDFRDLIRGTRILCSLLPHLMELDWVLGGFRYPEATKAVISDHWADWIAHWGLLPLDDLLTHDRRRILREFREDPSGKIEIAWDGRGEVLERFAPVAPNPFWQRLRSVLAERGLEREIRWEEAPKEAPAQLPLQAAVLDTLREGHEVGEPDTATESAAALHLASLLSDGGELLGRSARLATVATAIERHLRFTTIASVQGHPVQRATLLLPGELLDIVVLRDRNGIARLALARERPFYLTPGPPPRCVKASCVGREMDDRDLITRLRRDNYLAEGYDLPAQAMVAEQASLASIFAVANPLAPSAPQPGDHVVTGIIAAPGKATGVAVFYRPDLDVDELSGAILFAPTVRPEDAPLLRRAAAVVSTGGGILSHAGLIAMELRKPALVVNGHWRQGDATRTALACRALDHVEEEHRVGEFRVTLRRDLREREELLWEGDLVVVDAELGCLVVMGQDRDVLAVQEELRCLETVSAQMGQAREGPEKLALRGRLLRATHQLGKILSRLDQPSLARHAARELLYGSLHLAGANEGSASASRGRRNLLRRLFENRHCGAIALDAANNEESVLTRRLESLRVESLRALDTADTPHEVAFLSLAVQRLQETLDQARQSLAHAGAATAMVPAPVDTALEERVGVRLESMRKRYLIELNACADDRWWRSRPSLDALELMDDLLGPRPGDAEDIGVQSQARTFLATSAQRVRARLSGRTIITPADGGLELAPLIGAKGAGLGEIARILDPALVPSWFAVGDAAFRRVLAGGIGRVDASLGLQAGTPLVRAIAKVLELPDLTPRAQAAAIRALWTSVVLPADLVTGVREAYRALEPGSEESSKPFVAVRSSAFEEDSSRSSWAGQFDTFLYLRGEEAVLEHLKLAWASLWSERVLLYRSALHADEGSIPTRQPAEAEIEACPGGGILIQRIVHSRVSGVVHTLAAASGQPRELVINVGLGLGEGVVSGTVEVDQIIVSRTSDMSQDPLRFRYTVGDKRTRIVFDRRSGEGTRLEETLYHQRLRPALEYTDLCEIVRAAIRLEGACGHPLDLEFAFEGDSLYILQARPIVAFQDALREAIESGLKVRARISSLFRASRRPPGKARRA